MGDAFLKTLQSVVSGTRHLEEFAGTLVSVAVEDALLCVARDYGHQYASLVKRYKDEVVARHTAGSLSQQQAQCRGLTRANKPCGKRAVLHGYCQSHAAQMAEEETKRRRVEAYKSSVTHGRVDAETVSARLFLGHTPRKIERFEIVTDLSDLL